MATDFFQRQETARTNTKWLVVLFVVALMGIVGGSAVLATMAVYGFRESKYGVQQREKPFPWPIPVAAGAGALAVVGLGTLYKVLALRGGGGTGLAEHLGGVRLYPDASELHERRLLNVVEEMALASGTPVPPVYVLEENGINAFAAGYSPSDAVVGVTRGAMEQLSRSELQGVIAHEFSHILNGDMRMNIRLIGTLHGILILGLIGHFLLRSFVYSGGGRSRRSQGGSGDGRLVIAILAAAIALIVIGFLGNLIGGLIKAAVSRQREYLADASAVQFTRDPGGIAGALKRIGARSGAGSRLKHANAPEASHMFFAKGVAEGLTRAMATHPPLPKRILAIEPTWDGGFPEVEPSEAPRRAAGAVSSFAGTESAFAGSDTAPAAETAWPAALAAQTAETFDVPDEPHHQYVAQILSEIDPEIIEAAHEPYGARAVVYALLLDPDQDIRQRQLSILDEVADKNVAALTRKLSPAIDSGKLEARLPLVDLSLPALRSLSTSQYKDFDRCVRQLTAADERIDLFEWVLGQVLVRHLRPQFARVARTRTRYYGLQKLSKPCSILLSTLAYAGHSESTAEIAFAKAAAILRETRLVQLPKQECHLRNLHEALHQLREVAPKKRELIIDACAASICADKRVTVQEAELFRGIADLLDCPVPPLLAGQTFHGKTIVQAGDANVSAVP